MSHMVRGRTFAELHDTLKRTIVRTGQVVHTATWQGRDISAKPEMATTELLMVTTNLPLNNRETLEYWRGAVRPNLPWADDHFEERVSGAPMNPGTQWAKWPWGQSANTFRQGEIFNHNYMERYWPKEAGFSERPTVDALDWNRAMRELSSLDLPEHRGIRHTWGDLNDVVELLFRDPLTRQAYLPIFFPEDTGVGDGGRKPCTLGYQFIIRENMLHCFYPMRSCDLVRHYQDDVYMTIRLMLWVLERLRERDFATWSNVGLGSLTMHMSSLHCFANDMLKLRQEYGDR